MNNRLKAYTATTTTLIGTIKELIIAKSGEAAAADAIKRHGNYSVVAVEPIDMGPVVIADDAFRRAEADNIANITHTARAAQPPLRAWAQFAKFNSDELEQRPVTVIGTYQDGRARVRFDTGRTATVNTASLTYECGVIAQQLAA